MGGRKSDQLVALPSHWYKDESIGANGTWSFSLQEKVGRTYFFGNSPNCVLGLCRPPDSLRPDQLISSCPACSMGPPVVKVETQANV